MKREETAFKKSREELSRYGRVSLDTLLELFKERWLMERMNLKTHPIYSSKPCVGLTKKLRDGFKKQLRGYKMALEDISSDLGKPIKLKKIR